MGKEIVVYPYKMGSKSGKLLADTLDVLRVFPDRQFRPTKDSVVINWGNGITPAWDGNGFVFLNRPDKVMNAINKIRAFRCFRKAGVPIPTYTLDRDTAEQWLDRKAWVVCRQETEGQDGSGLILAKSPEEIVEARLYTKYIPIRDEYRAYVFNGDLLAILDKCRRSGVQVNPDIRTGGNNWVFGTNPKNIPKDLRRVAASAVEALGLDFGGVDIIVSKEANECFCLEVNTAPDIRETTVMAFAKAINNYVEQLR